MPLSVLIVDDDVLFCESLRRQLEQSGYLVSVAHTVAQAAAIVAADGVRAALIDWNLGSGGSGVQLGRALRRQGIATFMMSGYTTAEIRAAWRDPLEGFLQFYAKPLVMQKVLDDLERVERSIEDTEP